MNLVENKNYGLSIPAQLRRTQSHVPFTLDQRLVDQVARIFSRPYITRAVFNEWTKDKVVLKRANDGPDEVEAQLTDSNGQQLFIRFFWAWTKPDTLSLRFLFAKLFVGFFQISAEHLKEALDHISSRHIPLWRAAQIASHLALNPDSESFEIWIPRTVHELATLDQDTFEYSERLWKVVREKTDQETGMKEVMSEDYDGRRLLTLFDQNNQSISFDLEKDAFRPVGLLYFIVRKSSAKIGLFSEETLARIFARLSGVLVPQPLLAQWRTTIARDDLFKVRLLLPASADLAIWRLMAGHPQAK